MIDDGIVMAVSKYVSQATTAAQFDLSAYFTLFIIIVFMLFIARVHSRNTKIVPIFFKKNNTFFNFFVFFLIFLSFYNLFQMSVLEKTKI